MLLVQDYGVAFSKKKMRVIKYRSRILVGSEEKYHRSKIESLDPK